MAYEKNRRRPPVEDDGTLIEGRNAVLETLRAGRAVDKVFVAEGAHIGDVAAEARRHRVPVVTCDRRKLDGMSRRQPSGRYRTGGGTGVRLARRYFPRRRGAQ